MSQPGSDNPTDQHRAEDARAEENWWLDNPANVRLIVLALAIICVLLFLACLLYTSPSPRDS